MVGVREEPADHRFNRELASNGVDLVVRGVRIHDRAADLNSLLPEARRIGWDHDRIATAVGDGQVRRVVQIVEQLRDHLKNRLHRNREVLVNQIGPRTRVVLASMRRREQGRRNRTHVEVVGLDSKAVVQDVGTNLVHQHGATVQHGPRTISEETPLFLLNSGLLDLIPKPVVNRLEVRDWSLVRGAERQRLIIPIWNWRAESTDGGGTIKSPMALELAHERSILLRELRVHLVLDGIEIPVEMFNELLWINHFSSLLVVVATLQLQLDFGRDDPDADETVNEGRRSLVERIVTQRRYREQRRGCIGYVERLHPSVGTSRPAIETVGITYDYRIQRRSTCTDNARSVRDVHQVLCTLWTPRIIGLPVGLGPFSPDRN